MKRTALFMVVALPLWLAACGGPGGTPDSSVDQLIANAESQMNEAKKAGFLWNTTQKHLDTAKKAKADGDNEKAAKEAKRVIKESQLALDQAKASAQAKPHYQ